MYEARKEGYLLMLWIALPFSSWVTTESLSGMKLATRKRMEQITTQNRWMLKLVTVLLKTLAREDVSCIACLEGPRDAIGCKFPEVEKLRKIIPYEISFDGCAYELLDANGDPLYKPWTIQTNEKELFEPLSQMCPRHPKHGHCRGEEVRETALHIDKFAKAVMPTAMNWADTLTVVDMTAAMEDPDHDPTAASSNEPGQPVEEAEVEQTTLQHTLETLPFVASENLATRRLRQFHAAMGRTEGCKACDGRAVTTGVGRPHLEAQAKTGGVAKDSSRDR